jgi:hypothetical protein
MMKYFETNATECGIPGSFIEQFKAGHKKTEALERKFCAIAEQLVNVGGLVRSTILAIRPSGGAPFNPIGSNPGYPLT